MNPPQSEAYLDIVWRQFKKNRAAYLSLWLMLPLVLIAIFAPLIASDQPLVYFDGQEVLFPWFRALFNTHQAVDYLFNMALLAFLPWLIAALLVNARLRRRDVPGRRRLAWALGFYLALTAVVAGVFSVDAWRPRNRYGTRAFAEEEFRNPDARGYYVLIPFGLTQQDLQARFAPPLFRKDSQQYRHVNDHRIRLLGTDDTGRDVLVLMIYGLRIALTVGLVAVSLYVTIGVVLGGLAGYFGGKTDMLISRTIEVVLLFPSFFLILTLVALLEPSIYIIMVVIGITGWPTIARLIRGEVLKQRAIDYTSAARSLGASHGRILFRHILPNSLSPALVAIPFGIAGAIITEAGLSLLGFGVRPPTPSWGVLLRLGNENYSYWWVIVFPSLAIFFTVTVLNLIGSGLRDAMDPRLRM